VIVTVNGNEPQVPEFCLPVMFCPAMLRYWLDPHTEKTSTHHRTDATIHLRPGSG
jgi:hypothetical protein